MEFDLKANSNFQPTQEQINNAITIIQTGVNSFKPETCTVKYNTHLKVIHVFMEWSAVDDFYANDAVLNIAATGKINILDPDGNLIIENKHILSSNTKPQPIFNNGYHLDLIIDKGVEGELFKFFTEKNTGKTSKLMLDDNVISLIPWPMIIISSPTTGGTLTINLDTLSNYTKLVLVLNSGMLPYDVTAENIKINNINTPAPTSLPTAVPTPYLDPAFQPNAQSGIKNDTELPSQEAISLYLAAVEKTSKLPQYYYTGTAVTTIAGTNLKTENSSTADIIKEVINDPNNPVQHIKATNKSTFMKDSLYEYYLNNSYMTTEIVIPELPKASEKIKVKLPSGVNIISGEGLNNYTSNSQKFGVLTIANPFNLFLKANEINAISAAKENGGWRLNIELTVQGQNDVFSGYSLNVPKYDISYLVDENGFIKEQACNITGGSASLTSETKSTMILGDLSKAIVIPFPDITAYNDSNNGTTTITGNDNIILKTLPPS